STLDTLGGAAATASQLGGTLGTTLLQAAREAFTQGLRLTAFISALLAVSIAIPAVWLLRNVAARGGDHDDPGSPEMVVELGLDPAPAD
ncbi:MAG TPA: MFS transporter, partial [Acidimicrobiia bacterium]|nr:MFS transporter [Acidimicrobiia bacterium]